MCRLGARGPRHPQLTLDHDITLEGMNSSTTRATSGNPETVLPSYRDCGGQRCFDGPDRAGGRVTEAERRLPDRSRDQGTKPGPRRSVTLCPVDGGRLLGGLWGSGCDGRRAAEGREVGCCSAHRGPVSGVAVGAAEAPDGHGPPTPPPARVPRGALAVRLGRGGTCTVRPGCL